MTTPQPRVISFDMHPARHQQPAIAFAPPPAPPAPLRARAEIAAALSARIGGKLLTSDIVDLLNHTGAPDRPGLDHLSAAFRRAGYSVALDQDPGWKVCPFWRKWPRVRSS